MLTGTAAGGSVSFLETTASGTSLLGTAPLSGNTSTLSLASLPVGRHQLAATYTGDATHSSAQSTSLLLTVSPLQLTAVPNPASMLFGQSPPTLSGAITGILPQDAATVSVAFVSAATSTSPPGTYPIAVALGGSGAGNYSLATGSANVLVSRAPVTISLSGAPGLTGGTLSLTAHVASTTSGTPTGTVTFLDALLPLAAFNLDATGSSTWNATGLASGSHSLTAVYSGSVDFTPASSAASVITLSGSTSSTPAADFSLSPTGLTSQTVPAGATVNYTFSVALPGKHSLKPHHPRRFRAPTPGHRILQPSVRSPRRRRLQLHYDGHRSEVRFAQPAAAR